MNQRLDDLTHQLQRMGQFPAPQPMPPQARAAMPPAATLQPQGRAPAGWAAEILARQRALDGGGAPPRAQATLPNPFAPNAPSAPPNYAPGAPPSGYAPSAPAPNYAPAMPPPGYAPARDIGSLEQQLRQITNQIATLQRPYEDALAALRGDLAEIGRSLNDAMPRRAVEQLENEVRTLTERIDRSRAAGADGAALAGLERGLTEVRDALQNLKPAESLVGFEQAVQALSRKIDEIGSATRDPAAFQQIEQAIASLRGMVSNVASDGALAQLSAEVRGLASRFERAAAATGPETIAKLESQIANFVNSGRTVPAELEASIRALSERLDRIQLTKGDKFAIEALEDRIAKLTEKLDASDTKLGNLAAIERGMSELLVHLEAMRGGVPRIQAEPAPAAQPEPAPAPPPMPAAMAPSPVLPPQSMGMPAPAPDMPPMPLPAPAHIQYQPQGAIHPIDPGLPPDTPLEPGSGTPRPLPGSPAARIAASEASLAGTGSAATERLSKSAAVAAARNAARSATEGTSPAPKARRGWFSRSKNTAGVADISPRLALAIDNSASAGKGGVGRHVKSLLVAASVAVIVLVTLQMVIELFVPEDTVSPGAEQPSAPTAMPATPLPPAATAPPASSAPAPRPAPRAPGRGAMNTPETSPPFIDFNTTAQIFSPQTTLPFATNPADITGSVGNPANPLPRPASMPPATPSVPASESNPLIAALPSSMGPALRTAAAAGNPGAEYEIGARYADGRDVQQNGPEAIRWLERAANKGFVPAQFRLAGLYEKGEGVPKDLGNARRLYEAAAGKGHGKAMHNLAVLYAEGLDGKPDYKAAAHWFRKAALHGITDSQYNLAVLYARGVGTELNLAESYRWFALAAARGDTEAGRKRDEVAPRLDQNSLTAAKLAVQTFVVEPEPAEAVSLKAPPGGWEHTPTVISTGRPKPRPRASANP